ncbi:MAG: ABC transporter permease [Paeniclostridium sordellii]|nr:ABC transporter permease [Paeniclostridium sordellii]
MSNLALLMKINILNLIGYNKLKNGGKKEKDKAVGMALLIALTTVILVTSGFSLCFYLSDFLIQINQIELLLIIGIIGCSFVTLFTSLYKASSYLFQSKDYEMLASLPIKQSTILSSKILILILNNYLFASAFILIPGIVFFIKVDTSLLYIPFLIILTLAAPIIPILVSSLIAFLITNVSSRSKKNNFVSIILNLVLVAVVMLLSFNLQNIIMNLVQNSSSIIEVTKKIYPPAYYFVDALKNINIISLLIFLLISILPTALFIFVFADNFNKINSKLSETYKANNYKFKELKTSKSVIALLRKEINRYLSSTIYVINSSIGMILLPIFAIAIVYVGYDKIAQLLEMSIVVDMMKIQIIGVIAFCIIMTNTSCVSISLEGKNLWILKSSPIDEMEIFKSKILLNILLTIPISVISFLVIAIKLNFELKTIVVVILSIVLLSIFIAILGLFINLLYPKLEFTSDVQVVKQSASVIISMISNILYVAMLFCIGYIVKINNFEFFLIISNIITFISILVLYKLLKTKGVELFKNL